MVLPHVPHVPSWVFTLTASDFVNWDHERSWKYSCPEGCYYIWFKHAQTCSNHMCWIKDALRSIIRTWLLNRSFLRSCRVDRKMVDWCWLYLSISIQSIVAWVEPLENHHLIRTRPPQLGHGSRWEQMGADGSRWARSLTKCIWFLYLLLYFNFCSFACI